MKNVITPDFEKMPTQSERVASPSRKGRKVLVAGLALAALAVLPGCGTTAKDHKSVAPVATPDASPSITPNATLPGEVIPSATVQPDAKSELPLDQKFCTPAIKRIVANEVGLSTPNDVYCEETLDGLSDGPQGHFVANGREITISVEASTKASEDFKKFYSAKSAVRWGLANNHYLAATKSMGDGAVESKVQSGNRNLDILETGNGVTATNNQVFAQTVAETVLPHSKHQN